MAFTTDRPNPLRAAFDRTLARERLLPVDVRSRYGCLAYVVDGEPFALLTPRGLCFPHIAPETSDRLADERQVDPFEENGRRVESWTTVLASPDDVSELAPYVRESYETAKAVAADGDDAERSVEATTDRRTA